jgi:hypothetical protein
MRKVEYSPRPKPCLAMTTRLRKPPMLEPHSDGSACRAESPLLPLRQSCHGNAHWRVSRDEQGRKADNRPRSTRRNNRICRRSCDFAPQPHSIVLRPWWRLRRTRLFRAQENPSVGVKSTCSVASRHPDPCFIIQYVPAGRLVRPQRCASANFPTGTARAAARQSARLPRRFLRQSCRSRCEKRLFL